MKPLIDGDLIAYELAFGCQRFGEDQLTLVPVEEVNKRVLAKIGEICSEVYATEPPVLFFTGKTNFRNDIAKSKPYKGNRKGDKPHYLKYIRSFLMASYESELVEGLEADDLMSMRQTERLKFKDTIICTRDKDLRQVPGLHYGWECGKQPSFGPKWVDKHGCLELKGGKKLKGAGDMLLYAQMLIGDNTDNIGGARGWSDIKTYNLLKDCEDELSLYNAVESVYNELYGEQAMTLLAETAMLVWMVREAPDGIPVMWRAPIAT